ncbi:MAG TPA: TatD family hydrolase [Chthoniobacteraceae bacterium]|jgi:TatD DNase family protein|nr:TatD family hydrolase [Chthoniobacteraceae bacterium]
MRHYDAHNHLQDEWLSPHLPEIIGALEAMPIGGAVVNGTIDSDWDAVARLAREHAWVIPSYGVHPWRASERARDWEEQLRARLDAGGVIGEIGLDRWKEGYDFADQENVFRAQWKMAAERNLPATIHCLRAWGALWDIIRTEPVPQRGFLLHAYGGPEEMIECFVKRGAYFSFSGSFLAEPKHKKRDAFRAVPPDRLLVETDAPAMPLPPGLVLHPLPPAADGTPVNHPANLPAAYEGLAILRGLKTEILAGMVEENFNRLFRNI